MTLVRIRWQEAWGDRLGGVLEDVYTPDQAEGLLPGLRADWFPGGCELTQDPDSPHAWAVTGSDGRTAWFFLEPVGS